MHYNRQQILDMLSLAIPALGDEDLCDLLNRVNSCICEDFQGKQIRFDADASTFTDEPPAPLPPSPFDQGAEAYWCHKNVESCPYPAGTIEYRQWYEGWVWEQQDDEMCLDDLMFSTDGTE